MKDVSILWLHLPQLDALWHSAAFKTTDSSMAFDDIPCCCTIRATQIFFVTLHVIHGFFHLQFKMEWSIKEMTMEY